MTDIAINVVKLMQVAESMFSKGPDKKKYVLDMLFSRFILTQKEQKLISDTIDYIASIDKREIKIASGRLNRFIKKIKDMLCGF